MKTWIFDENKLDAAIGRWIAAQIATGHPSAVKNANFVGAAIKDMLINDESLFKDGALSTGYVRPNIPTDNMSVQENKVNKNSDGLADKSEAMSIETMKAEWEKMR